MNSKQDINEQKVVFEPIIDSQTPPVGVDNVILGESSTGSVRISGFAGNIFALKNDKVKIDGEEFNRLWIRPVCVIDLSPNAIKQIDAFLMFRLGDNMDTVKNLLTQYPEAREKIKELITEIENSHETN